MYWRIYLKILNLIVGDGEFRVESMGGEIHPADNVAKLIVDVEGAPPRHTPPSSAQPSHPGGATAGSGGGSGGGSGLPVTGTRTALIAAVGAGIILTGAILLLVGRRRRVRLETPAD
jgi:LPXTG-motif cell wall-anchored protein